MNILKAIGTGLGLATLAAGGTAYYVLNQITYSFGKPKNLQFDLYSLQFRLPFFVRNGSFLDLNVLGFDGQLFYGKDDKLADITIPNAFELKGGETATGEILISIDYGELLSELTEILRDGNILQSAYIKGRFKTSFISLPVRQKLLEAA